MLNLRPIFCCNVPSDRCGVSVGDASIRRAVVHTATSLEALSLGLRRNKIFITKTVDTIKFEFCMECWVVVSIILS